MSIGDINLAKQTKLTDCPSKIEMLYGQWIPLYSKELLLLSFFSSTLVVSFTFFKKILIVSVAQKPFYKQ